MWPGLGRQDPAYDFTFLRSPSHTHATQRNPTFVALTRATMRRGYSKQMRGEPRKEFVIAWRTSCRHDRPRGPYALPGYASDILS